MNGKIRTVGWSIRTKIMVLLSIMVAVMMGTVAFMAVKREQGQALLALRQRGSTMADMLATSCLVSVLRGELGLVPDIGDSVQRLAREQGIATDLRYLAVVDEHGRDLYHWGTDRLDPEDDRILSRNAVVSPTDNRLTRFLARDGEELLDATAKMSLTAIDGVVTSLGAVRVGLSLRPVADRVMGVTLWIVAGALLFVVLGIFLSYLGTKQPIDSMYRIGGHINRIAAGDFSQRVPVITRDEIGTLSRAVNRMAEDLEKRELLKQYISKTAWDDIEKRYAPQTVAFDREEGLQRVTILFMDIRNFTALSESRHSTEIVELLNEVFSIMVEVIEKHGGVVDKFIGDGLLVVFYPEESGDHALRAVYCAAEMQDRLAQFNRNRAFYEREAIRIGVGINTGEVIAGNIGSERRKDYTVIGDPVNVASRLQEVSKEAAHTGIVLSESTFQEVGSIVAVEALPISDIRGRRERVQCYELVRVRDIDAILEKIREGQGDDRKMAFRSVEASQEARAIPALVELLEEEDQDLILRAVMVLGRIGRSDDKVAGILEGLIDSTENKRILATAIKAVARLEGYPAIDKIVRFLIDEDARVRANTIEALDQVGQERFIDNISPLIYDPVGRVKANAAVALWKRGRFEVIRILEGMARSEAARERAGAAFAAGELFKISIPREGEGPGQTCEGIRDALLLRLSNLEALTLVLCTLLGDEDERVRRNAVRGLSRSRDARGLAPLAGILVDAPEALREEVVEAFDRIGAPIQVLRLLDRLRASLEGRGTATEG